MREIMLMRFLPVRYPRARTLAACTRLLLTPSALKRPVADPRREPASNLICYGRTGSINLIAMKNINPLGFFDEYFLPERLTKLKDPLVKLEKHIDWDLFRPVLEIAFQKPANLGKMGRTPFDRTTMFKLLVLQSLYRLADNQMEYQITDRLSFKRFLGLKSSNRVLDAKTIWKFRESLIEEGVIEALLFEWFNTALNDQCIFAKTAQIVDAIFVEIPRQCNSRDDNEQIKQYKTPEVWKCNLMRCVQLGKPVSNVFLG